MTRFSSSKGVHDVVMTPATRELLALEGHPDLVWRDNVFALEYGRKHPFDGFSVRLLDARHMLGSAQVVVEYQGGPTVGYSGDFSWPLAVIPALDELVVDASYGSDKSVRRFSRDTAESEFLQLVSDCLRRGVVTIKAHRGTLHRAAELLSGTFAEPIAVPNRVQSELEVYSQFGIPAITTVPFGSVPASSRHIRLVGHREAIDRYVVPEGSTVVLTGFRMRSEPVQVQSEGKAYSVCISDHADYEETLEYVSQTGARRVVVDNSRGGNGVELALGIGERLGIEVTHELIESDPY
jgi:Cft2 family RNA processing exonuclease